MARQLTLATKLLARGHNADPEKPFPEPVDHHTGRQWVGRIDKPLRQHQPIDLVGGCHRRRRQHGRHALPHLRTEVLPVAAILQLCHPTLVGGEFLKHRHGGPRQGSELLAKRLQQLAGRPKLRGLRGALGSLCGQLRNAGLDVGDLLLQRSPLGVDRLVGHRDQRRLITAVGVGGVVEHRVDLEELLLRDRIVFMRMTLGAGDRRAHPGAQGGVDPVDNRHRTKLLVDRATLAVGQRVAVEGGGDPVVERRLGKQIAGELFDGELIKRHVGIEGADHPVAVGPDRAGRVVGVAGAVGIAGEVEPLPGHVFAVAFIGQQPVDELLNGIARGVGEKRVDCFRRDRQTGQVEGQSASERRPAGLRLGGDALGFQAGEHEVIDRSAGPGGVGHLGQGRTHRRHVRPVGLVVGPRSDPFAERCHLGVGEGLARTRGRHPEVGVGGREPGEHLALVGPAGNDRCVATEVSRCAACGVEPQALIAAALPLIGVGAVAADAPLGEQRLDVAGEGRRRGLQAGG